MSETELRIDVDAALMVVDLKDIMAKKVYQEARRVAREESCTLVLTRHILTAIPVAMGNMQSAFSILDPEVVSHDGLEAA